MFKESAESFIYLEATVSYFIKHIPGEELVMRKGTITRRMDRVLRDLKKEFMPLYTKKDFESAYSELEKAGNYSDRPTKLKKLYTMFDHCGISYRKGQNNNYYRKLISEAKLPADYAELEEKMMNALYKMYSKYPSPEDYMKRLVDRLSKNFPGDNWQNDSLRLRILKQFIKYGDYLNKAGFGGRQAIRDYVKSKRAAGSCKINDIDIMVLQDIDDGVFDLLKTATKDQRKPGGRYGLLKAADDLAFGKFRAEGASKKDLYMFAIVYNMTYYTGSGIGVVNYDTDIEKNLFYDFYTNNLIRFITDAYKGKLDEYEKDPSGQGINYKNFAEMIYLYYICRDYRPQDKVRLSSEMIERVKSSSSNNNRTIGTIEYRNLFTDDILRMDEKEFELFICRNYNCNVNSGNYSLGPMQMETEQNTAFQVYEDILKEWDQLRNGEISNYGLWFTDVPAFTKNKSNCVLDTSTDIDKGRLEDFKALLSYIQTLIEGKEKLHITNPKAVSRTAVIIAYYYYNEKHIEDRGRNFRDVYRNFENEINPLLEKAFYQKLNGKNIFDVVIAFSCYAWQTL